jgi:hypothetical protein
VRVLSINSEEHWSTFGETTTERATRDYCNDDDELERVRDPDETKTIVVVALVFVVVESVATRFDDDDDDDDAKRTMTRETCKTTSSGENKDESEA